MNSSSDRSNAARTYSWWPLWCGLTLAVVVLGIVFGWWLFLAGCGIGIVTLSGFIFEYYRGDHAH